MNYIFEQVHHIDRHELPIDSVSLSTDAGIAVVVTRNCIGIWDLLTGKMIHDMHHTLSCLMDSSKNLNGCLDETTINYNYVFKSFQA